MKRFLIAWLGTLLTVTVLGFVAALVLASALYCWCKETAQAAWPQLKTAPAPQALHQSRQASSLE